MVRRRPIAALVAAEAISATGSQMTYLALPWFVLTTTALALAAAGPVLEELGTQPALAGVATLSSIAAAAGIVAGGRERALISTRA